MTDRPIIFSGEMVRALLAGRKTQTRRIAIRQDIFRRNGEPYVPTGVHSEAPFNRPGWAVGDRLWVRESWSGEYFIRDTPPAQRRERTDIWYWADGNPEYGDWERPRPSIHMPRWASRLTLGVSCVRVQRLHEISPDDVEAEGVEIPLHHRGTLHSPHRWKNDHFKPLWQSIHGATGLKSWDANPWVIAISFSLERRNIDDKTAMAAE